MALEACFPYRVESVEQSAERCWGFGRVEVAPVQELVAVKGRRLQRLAPSRERSSAPGHLSGSTDTRTTLR